MWLGCARQASYTIAVEFRHRQVPSLLRKMKRQRLVTEASQKRKQQNRERHAKPGTYKHKPEREQQIVKEVP